MSRQGRVARFRHQAGQGGYATSLRASGAHRPCDDAAIWNWRASESIANPVCFGCRSTFSAERRPGAFLTVRSSRSPQAGTAVSAVCNECWTSLTPDAIELAALELLRRNLNRHGHWMDGA